MSEIIHIPRGTPGAGQLTLDMREIYQLEVRKQEVATVTKFKAQELLYLMEKGYSAISTDMLPKVLLELNNARDAAEARKAVVMLDVAPVVLREKKLTKESNPGGTADQRESVLALDEEYRALKKTVDQLEAVYEWLKGKMKGFEMSYQSVKKVYDNQGMVGGAKVT